MFMKVPVVNNAIIPHITAMLKFFRRFVFTLLIVYLPTYMRFNLRPVYSMTIQTPNKLIPYRPPDFAAPLRKVPSHRLNIANLPTPVHRIPLPSELKNESVLKPFQELNIELLIKRDDMSAGVELGGNKIRKLEFLLADALQSNCDSVVTIGGEQSNHCRATAAACRLVGLEPHLILRTKRANRVEEDKVLKQEDSFGYVGNLLFDRIAGSRIYTCTPGEYGRLGSEALVDRVCAHLCSSEGKIVYPIPVGGSNGVGTWGYVEAIHELKHQLNGDKVHHVVFACGSGGTASGIALGLALGYREEQDKMPEIHAVGVCDDPEYFYQEVTRISEEMDFDVSSVSTCATIEQYIKEYMTVHQGKGKGYASSTEDELSFIVNFALETGIVLDPGTLLLSRSKTHKVSLSRTYV
jgi:1-aminocyclopropane-1-carboxylate deaminase/D-cysteine desulfhydrase-like pyridoxal-dependent ACC family enzyme